MEAAPGQPEDFRPASFRGLILGKTMLKDFEKRFGKPFYFLRDKQGTDWAYYEDIAELPGRVELIADSKTGIVETIDLTPKEHVALSRLPEIFKAKFRLVYFEEDRCKEGGLHEVPTFNPMYGLTFWVADHLGIAVSPNADSIKRIDYLSKPTGSKTQQCKGENIKH